MLTSYKEPRFIIKGPIKNKLNGPQSFVIEQIYLVTETLFYIMSAAYVNNEEDFDTIAKRLQNKLKNNQLYSIRFFNLINSRLGNDYKCEYMDENFHIIVQIVDEEVLATFGPETPEFVTSSRTFIFHKNYFFVDGKNQ